MGSTSVPSRPRPRDRAPGGRPLEFPGGSHSIVGASPRMQRIFKLVRKVAATDSTVLVIGESGTGKELIARALHLQSRRAEGPFVPVNVGAIPESLIESELFGAARGAFTGAAVDRPGLIEEADGGTLFLDEIGDMPPATQVKLLRVLENSEVRRLGDTTTRIVNVRVLAATHRDLQAEIAAGRFRQDLYYRLNVVQIDLPPLRERREDIGLLASFFLDRLSRREGRPGLSFGPEAAQILERYDYPGNVRELENAIEHAVAVGEGPVIAAEDLPTAMRVPRLLPSPAEAAPGGAGDRGDGSVAVPEDRSTWSLAQVERDQIVRALERHGGNATAAARQLGVSRTTLWRKMRSFGIERPGR